MTLAAWAPLRAQEPSGLTAVEKAAAALAPKGWKVPRTPDGKPDLQGIYNNGTITPFERPTALGNKAFYTPSEAAEYTKRTLANRDMDRRDVNAVEDVTRAYNDLFWDRGTELTRTLQTSIIVEPDGKVPPLRADVQKRVEAMADEIKKRCETEVCSPANAGGDGRGLGNMRPATGPEDRPYMERCILQPTGGPPMLPSAYNNNFEFIQTPDTLVILIEMAHDFRVIPLNGMPHADFHIRELMGDSRGHWEGDVLVVDTTNFREDTNFRWAGKNMHLMERFSRVAPDAILYEFTVSDPTTFVRPWSGAYIMNAARGPIFEYACHEGNYGLAGILSGARAEEAKRAASH